MLVQAKRDTDAAERFFRQLLATVRELPERIIIDKLGSYGAATARISELQEIEHLQVRSRPDQIVARSSLTSQPGSGNNECRDYHISIQLSISCQSLVVRVITSASDAIYYVHLSVGTCYASVLRYGASWYRASP